MRTVNAFVGQPIERLEDLRLVRGRGQYVDDLARKDMLHAAILRSAVAHGRIRTIDVSRAQKIPGVHAVITAADLGDTIPLVPMRLQPMPEFEAFGQPVMARTPTASATVPRQAMLRASSHVLFTSLPVPSPCSSAIGQQA